MTDLATPVVGPDPWRRVAVLVGKLALAAFGLSLGAVAGLVLALWLGWVKFAIC